jgi:hypothetical protein
MSLLTYLEYNKKEAKEGQVLYLSHSFKSASQGNCPIGAGLQAAQRTKVQPEGAAICAQDKRHLETL